MAVLVVGGVATLASFSIRSSAKRIESLAGRNGVSEMQRQWFSGAGIRGMWRGYRTDWRIRGGGKQPLRAVVDIFAATPARLIIMKKVWWNFTPFGPPAIDVPMYPQLVVRGDDVMLANRLLGDEEVRRLIEFAMTNTLDRLELSTSIVRVQRFILRSSVDRDERMTEAFTLASAVVLKLGLPPAG
jgi:hypothetical protein